ncbi:MAG TPA: MBL fold metallo-hydrolase, partial [Burkholderiaceae bacterium]|nr:MBL fold metallo-hydrolase [Burkholderiaceae bacterium]
EEFDWWQSGSHAGVQLTATPAQHFSGRTPFDRNSTLWASWVIRSGGQTIFYSGDSGYFPGFKQIGERFGGIDLALIESGAYDSDWPSVHMTPEQTVQAFQDLRGSVLCVVHNSTFELAFHPWQDPLERVATLARAKGLPLATPEIGEVLTIGQPRTNVLWWQKLK